MKKGLKIAALVLSLVLIAGLMWFADGLVGNPISKHLAEKAAQARMEEVYGGTDYVLDEITYSFKDGGYYARVSSPSSIDSEFTMAFNRKGQLCWDSYEDRVLRRENTARRLDWEYRELTDRVFESPSFPYACDIAYSVLEFVPRAHLNQPGIPAYAMAMEELELDKVYDVDAMGAENGQLVITVESDTVTAELAAEIMVQIRSIMDDAGVGFRVMDFCLQPSMPQEGPRPENWIGTGNFPYEDIYEEGMVERVKAADEALKAYYAEQDAKKDAEIAQEKP